MGCNLAGCNNQRLAAIRHRRLFEITIGDSLGHVAHFPAGVAAGDLGDLVDFVDNELAVHVGEELGEGHLALEDGHKEAALLEHAGLEVELVLLLLGIGDIAEVADLLVGELALLAVGADDGELAVLAQFGDGVDEDLLAGDVAEFDGLVLGHLVDVDVGGDDLAVDDLGDHAHTVLGHEAVDERVERAGELAVGYLVGLLEGADGLEFLGAGVAALGVLGVETDGGHDAVVQPVGEADDGHSQHDLDDCSTFHIGFSIFDFGCKIRVQRYEEI